MASASHSFSMPLESSGVGFQGFLVGRGLTSQRFLVDKQDTMHHRGLVIGVAISHGLQVRLLDDASSLLGRRQGLPAVSHFHIWRRIDCRISAEAIDRDLL